MAKKNFDNLKNSHLGGGLSNLIPEMNEDYESKKTKVTYSRYMAFHSNSKYPLKRSLSDAIKLLREAHPEIQ
jgi:hypothetical protein